MLPPPLQGLSFNNARCPVLSIAASVGTQLSPVHKCQHIRLNTQTVMCSRVVDVHKVASIDCVDGIAHLAVFIGVRGRFYHFSVYLWCWGVGKRIFFWVSQIFSPPSQIDTFSSVWTDLVLGNKNASCKCAVFWWVVTCSKRHLKRDESPNPFIFPSFVCEGKKSLPATIKKILG